MNIVLIDTFLTVAQCKSITQAANQLFVSQSTVTTRLQTLEEKVGAVLIDRQKGVRGLELTAKGKAFVPIAESWKMLDKKTEYFIRGKEHLSLVIASPDSLNVHFFPPLFQKLMQSDPPIFLNIRTHQSPEIYALVDNHKADIGFVFSQSRYNSILTQPILNEKMVIICSSKGNCNNEKLHPSELNPEYEVFLPWSPEIVFWHDKWWNSSFHPYAQVDTASLLVSFMNNPNCWALCPISVAKSLETNSSIVIRECAEPIPDRICYMLTRKTYYRGDAPEIVLFQNCLNEFIQSLNYLAP